MAESVLNTPDLKDLEEEELWDLINDNRHAISLGVRPCVLIPYLRQARVLTDLDEDEILTCLNFTNRGHMIDLLRVQGHNGAMALLESLMIHYPALYTRITGRQPSIEPSGFSGLINYTELTEYLVRAVSSMQTELHVARHEAARLQARCCELQGKLDQAQQNNKELSQMQGEHARLVPNFCLKNHYVSRASAPPFLMRSRPQALRITGRVLAVFFQGEMILNEIQVIGGNKTGVFVHDVTEGSSAHNTGISPGSQILQLKYEREQRAVRMVLEDTTMEEALWALGQVQGPCHITLRPSQDGKTYENLLQQLKNGEVMSGDSFYIRVNMTMQEDVAGTLSVKCNDIVHVTDTHHSIDGSWWASHVHPCHLEDLKSGTLPNYYRYTTTLFLKILFIIRKKTLSHEKQRTARIVITGQQSRNPLWVSVEDNNTTTQDSDGCVPSRCVTLMPYTLVSPRFPPICRPVLLLPTLLGRVLHKQLAEQDGYQICQPGKNTFFHKLNTSLSTKDFNLIKGTHCVLPLGLDCVRRLHRGEIFPIIIYIMSSERSLRKLRHKLRQNVLTESQVLECSCSEEPLLDKLPCLYQSIPPESWHDSTTLIDTLKTVVTEEQQKIVWVESDTW
uniref:Caspase recruitment domain family, member 14 n=1 Tax=Sinocyclocheilus anshuiensis TaxID=1608454 RepID=A0A671Q091_9TELE